MLEPRFESSSGEAPYDSPPKGEVVVLVGPPVATAPAAEEVDARLTELLGEHGVRGAAEAVAAATGLPRRDLYQRALALKTREEQSATGTEDEGKP